ncbi:carotenoid biosynthesis protein [Acidisoma cellulosilytica]|uniref:Carotenoid biosynthesis protein n=1 Tax=Acidisoma cellulosilyticum TaxID=2802395 RepID=A0A964E5Z6_9PROT|nr:carotenoid biosynthesis protein [Acidisoma cellulosilyticum]MCB8883200.1 carotenoid biosynthesis protein [Acidisoma cellulosilyticum]
MPLARFYSAATASRRRNKPRFKDPVENLRRELPSLPPEAWTIALRSHFPKQRQAGQCSCRETETDQAIGYVQANEQIISNKRRFVFRRCLAIAFAGLVPAILYEGARANGFAQALAGLAIALLTAHAFLLLGAIRTITFASICLAITFAAENLSIATGVPFGRYHFLFGQGSLHIGAVPFIIGPVYFGFAYQSWIIASVICGSAFKETHDRLSLFAVPIVAAFTITQWDLVIDPSNATVDRNWVWQNGGGFLGVPLSNYLGWFLTTWIVFQLFQLAIHLIPSRVSLKQQGSGFLMLPILTYMASGLCYVIPPFQPDRLIMDGSGRVWSTAAIRTVAETLALLTILPTACFALIQLARHTK